MTDRFYSARESENTDAFSRGIGESGRRELAKNDLSCFLKRNSRRDYPARAIPDLAQAGLHFCPRRHSVRKFIDNWANDNFAGWVDYLKNMVNSLAENGSGGVREKMRLIYLRTMQYEYLFRNMAHSGETWPH